MVHNMLRNEYIERVDATLTGRPYDKQLAMGATAARWPGDGVDGSMTTAVATAIKMDADMHKLREEEENYRKQEQSDAASNAAAAEEAAVEHEERQKASGDFSGRSSD